MLIKASERSDSSVWVIFYCIHVDLLVSAPTAAHLDLSLAAAVHGAQTVTHCNTTDTGQGPYI